MKNLTILAAAAVCALTLSSCFLTGNIGLIITNLQTPTTACAVEASDSKAYLTLTYNFVGKVDSMRIGFTPYGTAGNKPSQFVVIADVNTPPAGVKLPFPSSTTITVKVNLADVVVSASSVAGSAGQAIAGPESAVQPLGVTQPDPKVSLPMNITLSASNTKGEQSGPLTLNSVDVGGCYPTTATTK